ncbi:nuclear transport factor 2 family protein [Kribbella ginsengisoli]|uniref:SnoaL-like domain-containing protein n=1 Tax=Kribbella ginsengisoli TaxID=363865 RepID=A0ABP6YC03_9ACTN
MNSGTSPAMQAERSSRTAVVMEHNMEAFARGDLDAVVADYADDAVVVNDLFGIARGRSEILALFEKLLSEVFPPDRVTVEHIAQVITGGIAFYTWRANNVTFGTDTFVVEDGKIVLQTFAAQFIDAEEEK